MNYLFLLLSLVLPPCQYEDDPNCYWDAGGSGTSFVALGYEETGQLVIYENGHAETYPRFH